MTHDDDYGTLSADNGTYTLRFERRLSHPVERVWQALTEPGALRQWFPQDIEGDLSPGGKLRFVFREGDYENMPVFEGEVLEYDPPRLLAFSWGPDSLRWELRPHGDGCLLILTDTLGELGKAARDGAGWHACLDALGASLDGREPPAASGWARLHGHYVDAFGPEASTLGPPEPPA
jgi:uncharacterized protein YndB with AHSA1/START domain